MKEVAAEAGVSVSTVSLALANSPLVAEATRLNVHKTAKQLGYITNPLVSALMQNRRTRGNSGLRPNLALITGHKTKDGWKISETLKAFHSATFRRAEERGFNIESIWRYDLGMTDRRFTNILTSRGVRGILLFPFEDPAAHLDLDWSAFATMALGFSISNAFDRVACDHFRAMRLAVSKCHQLGYRRIGFASLEHMHRRVDERWLGGYLTALYDLPEIGRPRLLIPAEPEWNPTVVETWLRMESPDVIITSEPAALQRFLQQTGRCIPKDIGLVSLMVPQPDNPQTGIFQNPALQATRAVDRLIDRILRNELGLPAVPTNSLIEGTWVPGTTVTSQIDQSA